MKKKRESKSQEKNLKKQNENNKKRSKSPNNNLKEEKYKLISDLSDNSNKIGRFIVNLERNQKNYGENRFNSISQISQISQDRDNNIESISDFFDCDKVSEKEVVNDDINFKTQYDSLNKSNKFDKIFFEDYIKSKSEKICLNKKIKRIEFENQKKSNLQKKNSNRDSVSNENQFKNTEICEDSDNNSSFNNDMIENYNINLNPSLLDLFDNNNYNNYNSFNNDDTKNDNNNDNDTINDNNNNNNNYNNNNNNNNNNNIIIIIINKITKIFINNINNHIISKNNNNIKNAINNHIIDKINNKINNKNKNKDRENIELLKPYNYKHYEKHYYYYYKNYMIIKPEYKTIEYIISDNNNKLMINILTSIMGISFQNENDLIKEINNGIIYQNFMNYVTKTKNNDNIIFKNDIKKFMPAEMIDLIKTFLLNVIIDTINAFEEMEKSKIKKIDNDLINNQIKSDFNSVYFDMPLFLILSNDSKYKNSKNSKNLNKESILTILNSKVNSKEHLELIKYLNLKVKDIMDIIRYIKIDPTGKISLKLLDFLKEKFDNFEMVLAKKDKSKDGLNKYIDLLYENGYFDRNINIKKVIAYVKNDYIWTLLVLAFNMEYFFDLINISRGFKNHGKLLKLFWRKVIIKIFCRKLKSFESNNYKKV